MRSLKSITAGLFVLSTAVSITFSAALSAPLILPPGIERGDQYRLAFVTSATTTGLSSDIEFYNSFVSDAANAVAELAAFQLSWKAIVSTLSIDARDNTVSRASSVFGGSLGVPIFLLDGTKLADSNDDLWDGTLDALFDVAEDGSKITSGTTAVGTGSRSDGTAFTGRTMGGTFPEIGSILSDSSSWIQLDSSLPSSPRRIFALTDIIFLSIPEPGPLGLLSVGLAGLVMTRRRLGRQNA